MYGETVSFIDSVWLRGSGKLPPMTWSRWVVSGIITFSFSGFIPSVIDLLFPECCPIVGAFLRRTFRGLPRTGCRWPPASEFGGVSVFTRSDGPLSVFNTLGVERATDGNGCVAARGGNNERALCVDGILEGFDDATG